MKKSLLIALGLTVNVGLYAQLNGGLVAYYPFNGNSNDESGNGNHSISNTASLTTDRDGNTNSAYQFNGSTFMEIPGNLTNTSDFSISLWFESQSATNPDLIQRMICFFDESTERQRASLNYNIYTVRYVDARLQSLVSLEDPGQSIVLEGSNQLPINEWHHVALTVSRVEAPMSSPPVYYSIDLYIDGFNNEHYEMDYEPITADKGFIGTFSDVYMQTMLGKIDDIAIFSRALDSGEITQLYNGDSPLGVSELESSISIYPNPTTSNISIQLETPTNLTILSSDGKAVATLSEASTYNFDASNLENGIYFIQAENGGVQKFVKQ